MQRHSEVEMGELESNRQSRCEHPALIQGIFQGEPTRPVLGSFPMQLVNIGWQAASIIRASS